MKKIIIFSLLILIILYASFNNLQIIDSVSKYFVPNITNKNYNVKIPKNMHLFINRDDSLMSYYFGFIPDNKITRYFIANFLNNDLILTNLKSLKQTNNEVSNKNSNEIIYILFDNSHNEYDIVFHNSDIMKHKFKKLYTKLKNTKEKILYSESKAAALYSALPTKAYMIIFTDDTASDVSYYFEMGEYILYIHTYVKNKNLEYDKNIEILFDGIYEAINKNKLIKNE
jgi:hypothetical protein